MGFDIRISPSAVHVALSGWDRVMNWRRSVDFDMSAVVRVRDKDRASLEALVEHRALGFGTHNGKKRSNRRRVGTMLGRSVAGKQFWAVPTGEDSARLLVLDMGSGDFKRAVLAVDDPAASVLSIRQYLAGD